MRPDPLPPFGPRLVRETVETPWKAVNELRRIAAVPFLRAYFALHGVRWGRGWRVYGLPLIQRHRRSFIEAGDGLELRSWFSSNPLGVGHRCVLATWSRGATIEIGRDVGMSGATLCANGRIRIGDRVLLGAGTTVVDTDFHPLAPDLRDEEPSGGASAPIEIEDDCFLGMNVIVLKGAFIGRGSVVGAGSVVAGRIAERSVVAGNPARLLRTIDAPTEV
jgi:acetyltransferase-like isoleucine patch superfamily enzyme